MFKIGEFSKLGQVSVRMLRYYDQMGLLKPGHTDKWTGYRYYTIEQLARLNRIVALNGLGLTLQQIGDLLAKDDQLPVERLRGMLMMRRAEIERELQEKQLQLASVEARLQQIEQEDQPSPYEIVVKAVAPLPVASLRQTVPTISQIGYYCLTLYEQLYAGLQAHGIAPLSPEVTLYHTDEYRETDIEMEIALPVAAEVLQNPPATEQILWHTLPAEDLVAALIFEGQFEEITPAILALLAWVGACRHTVAGPLRELHLSGPAAENHKNPGIVVIELQIPIKKIAP